ncbi:MAG: hypothetical protein RLZZ342_651 [Candidatus Parcubacteria bacterium]|jgi:hypothetical protein
MEQQTKSWLITGGIILAILILAGWGISKQRPASHVVGDDAGPTEEEMLKQEESAPVPTIKNSEIAGGETVSVEDQAPGTSVAISQVTLKRPSWVAIKDTNDWVLGAAWFNGSGENLSVPLLRATTMGDVYQAVIYMDNGDKKFDRHVDTLLVSAEGAPVSATFRTE